MTNTLLFHCATRSQLSEMNARQVNRFLSFKCCWEGLSKQTETKLWTNLIMYIRARLKTRVWVVETVLQFDLWVLAMGIGCWRLLLLVFSGHGVIWSYCRAFHMWISKIFRTLCWLECFTIGESLGKGRGHVSQLCSFNCSDGLLGVLAYSDWNGWGAACRGIMQCWVRHGLAWRHLKFKCHGMEILGTNFWILQFRFSNSWLEGSRDQCLYDVPMPATSSVKISTATSSDDVAAERRVAIRPLPVVKNFLKNFI